MKKPLVILTHPFLPEVIRQEFLSHQALGAAFVVAKDRKQLLYLLAKADGLITRFSDRVNEPLLQAAPNLKVVGNFAVGFDNIDLKACLARGVRVVNTPDVLTRATAELTVALIFAAARRISEGHLLCLSGRFKGWAPDMLLGQQLQGAQAVLVGRGRIGLETGKILRGIGMNVVFIKRTDSEASIRRKLARADVLSFHVSLNPSTRHWLSAERIGFLPRNSVVVNTTRGAVIDENALIQALQARHISAAGLDVFEGEPKIPRALRELPNVVLLPHLGSATTMAREAMARLVTRGVLGILSGKRVRNEVK